MTAAGAAQHLVVHGLGPELNGLDAIPAQARKHLLVDGVRPGGEADRVDLPRIQSLLRRSEQLGLPLGGNGRKAAAVKGELPLLIPRQALRRPDRLAHGLRRGRALLPGDAPLVAEHTGVRAAQMRHENRDDRSSGAHSFSLRSASQAAICSASFLVRPLPSPALSPLMVTRKEKSLL